MDTPEEQINDDTISYTVDSTPPATTIEPRSDNIPSVKYIIDTEGFFANKKFMPKEFSYIDVDEIGENEKKNHKLYYFKVGSFVSLKYNERKSAAYVYNRVHGLKFEDDETDLNSEEIRQILKKLCHTCELENRYIGFKGGQIEYKYLSELGYPYLAFNLENLSCPLFNDLITLFDSDGEKTKELTCSRHSHIYDKNGNIKQPHCAKLEVWLFKQYYKQCCSDVKEKKCFYDSFEQELKHY